MDSFEELQAYLKEECFSPFALMIGKSYGQEGYVVWQSGSDFCFGYSERGETRVLETFASEKEVIEYALKTVVFGKDVLKLSDFKSRYYKY